MVNSNTHRIYLIGMMASGKSTVGKLLASRLGYSFVDMDAEIEEKSGKSVSDIFRDEGEEHFRQVESQLLISLSQESKIVISTGGGTPIQSGGIEKMLTTGRVIWLKVSMDTIFARLKNDISRPLAQNITKNKLSRIVRSRNPIYKQAEIKVWNKSELEDVVEKIMFKL